MQRDQEQARTAPAASVKREEALNFMLAYQQMIMLYESAAKCVTMRLEIMKNEGKVTGKHTAIRTVTSRIKEPASIDRKLRKLGVPLSIDSIREHLNDVAGVRVICAYLKDIYTVRDLLLSDGQLELLQEKDYIKSPKANGYRSLHLIVSVPVPLKDGTELVKCEIQLRTTAMDSWAALEHQLRYKRDAPSNDAIDRELEVCAELLHETDLKMQRIAEQIAIFPKET